MCGCANTLGCHQLIDTTLLVSSQARQAIFERLLHRNGIRREIGMQPIDIPEAYRRKIAMTVTAEYQALLEPYLVAAFASVDWPHGFTSRLLQAVKLHRKAVADLYFDKGITDPQTKNPNMVKIMGRIVPGGHNSMSDRLA